MDEHRRDGALEPSEALREGVTMALYLSLVAAAEFTALSHQARSGAIVIGAIWGTTIGVTIAHLFAFSLSERLFSGGRLDRAARVAVRLQLIAAIAVASILTVPVLMFEVPTAIDVDGYLVAALIGITGYAIARSGRLRPFRALVVGLVMLLVAVGVVSVKVALSGH